MQTNNELMIPDLATLQKELPSLEAVYEYLDDFVRENEHKFGPISIPIMKARTIMSQLRIALLDEADKLADTDRDAWKRDLRHMCNLYFRREE